MQTKQQITKKLLAMGLAGVLAVSGGYLVAPLEGYIPKTYVDPVGILTSCYGHTGKELKVGQVFSEDECLSQLAKDLSKHDREMMSLIKVPLSDNQHVALLSFTYNVGLGNFKSSTLLKKLNEGKYKEACNELTKWVFAKGKKLNGLVSRREVEKSVCLGETKLDVYLEGIRNE